MRITTMKHINLAALLLAAICFSLRASSAESVNVFAAASLTDSLKEIASDYSKKTGDHVVFNFAATSTLARQIEAGAPADIFFSADEAKADVLEKEGLLAKETRQSRLSNSLVIVVPCDSVLGIKFPQDLTQLKVKRITLGNPLSVPIGIYSKEYLRKLQLWSAIEAKVIPTENVRAALAAVESGNADASIVYKTDAAISKRVKVVFEVTGPDKPQISYPMAMVKDTKHPEAARRFLAYLASESAGAVFKRYGFIVTVP